MTNYDDDYVPRLLATCVAGLLIMAACMLYCLPRPIAIVAISWAMLSISVGVSFGHSVLSEP